MRVYSADWVLPVEGEPIRDGAIAVEDGRIAAVGPASELPGGERFEGAAIVPGFVNAHTHLEYAAYAGFGDGLSFVPWILTHVERKRRVGWEEHLAQARFGAAECLRSGVTTVGEASFSGAAAFACAEAGLRAIVHLEVFGPTPEQAVERFERLREHVADAFSERVRVGISPHTPASITDEVYGAAAALGLPVMTHLAESEAELEWCRDGTGPMAEFAAFTPVARPTGTSAIRRLAEAGQLGPHLTAAHCVHVDAEDIALLARHDVGVVHCPRSNALLGCGTAPLTELRAAGIRVGLGTDSPASTPSFDVFDELRAAVLAARARERRADALTPAEALELATLGSARALGLEHEVGSLVAGKRADAAVVSLRGSRWLPWEDARSAVVLGGSPDRVLLTLVDGEPRYRKGEENGWHALTAAAQSARARLLSPLEAETPLAADR